MVIPFTLSKSAVSGSVIGVQLGQFKVFQAEIVLLVDMVVVFRLRVLLANKCAFFIATIRCIVFMFTSFNFSFFLHESCPIGISVVFSLIGMLSHTVFMCWNDSWRVQTICATISSSLTCTPRSRNWDVMVSIFVTWVIISTAVLQPRERNTLWRICLFVVSGSL